MHTEAGTGMPGRPRGLLGYLLAKVVSAGLVLGWNFSGRRLTLFRA